MQNDLAFGQRMRSARALSIYGIEHARDVLLTLVCSRTTSWGSTSGRLSARAMRHV